MEETSILVDEGCRNPEIVVIDPKFNRAYSHTKAKFAEPGMVLVEPHLFCCIGVSFR
jgi:hypothetical protein